MDKSKGIFVMHPLAEKHFEECAGGMFKPKNQENGEFQPKQYEFVYCEMTRAWSPWSSKDGKNGNHGGFELSWGVKDFGFGTLTFRIKGGKRNEETDELEGTTCHCDNEMMDKNFIRQALVKFVDSIILDDEPVRGDTNENNKTFGV